MANPNVLSEGSINSILELKNDSLVPVVQILGSKMMNNNRLRAVITDGASICQHCIFTAEGMEKMFNDGLMSKFTIVRLEEYTVSSLPNKGNITVMLVSRMTILKSGEEVGHKLEAGEPFSEAIKSEVMSGYIQPIPLSTANPTRAASTPASLNTSLNTSASQGTIRKENICPINVISPFYSAWTIRARVTNKPPMRTYNNKNGPGKLFSFDVIDDSGEIRITAFNAEVDRFYDIIEEGKMFYISKGTVKAANKKFTTLNNDFEITLGQGTLIEPCTDAVSSMPQIRFKFIPLSDLTNSPVGTTVDIIGVIRSVDEVETFTSKKSQKEMTKRDVTLADKSMTEVRATLWFEKATNFSGQVGQILALKCCVVGDYNGKNVSTNNSSIIQVDPDIPETQLLQTWINSLDNTLSFTALSRNGSGGVTVSQTERSVCQITTNSVNPTGPTYFNVNGTIQTTNRPSNHLYKSCGKDGCMKKVTDDGNGIYNCSKCANQSPSFEWRMMLSMLICDSTGGLWITCFHELAQKLIGHTAEEMANLYDSDQVEYGKVVNAVRFKSYQARVGVKIEEYNGESRVRATAYTLTAHQPLQRTKRLMAMIDIMSRQTDAY